MNLSTSERDYVASRLRADGIAPIPEQQGGHDIPIVIADREILDVYDKADARAARMLRDQERVMLIMNRPAPAMHVAAPNWRDKWTWIGIGVGTTLSIQITMLLVYAWVVTR